MSLFCLLCCTQQKTDNETYILNYVYNQDLKGSNDFKNYVKEIAKAENVLISEGENEHFKKGGYKIYAIKMGMPSVTFLAYTKKKYPAHLAFACLNKY